MDLANRKPILSCVVVGRAMLAPIGISKAIRWLKVRFTKHCRKDFWQKSFYDHVIRDEADYPMRWNCIYENPVRWCNDEFFAE